MPTAELHAERTHEADELREELDHLQSAIASLSDTLADAHRDRETAEARVAAVEQKIAEHRMLLDQAMTLQAVLQDRLHELEDELDATRAELSRERTTAAIRGKLLTDIADAHWWARGRPIERAVRVERLLGSSRAAG